MIANGPLDGIAVVEVTNELPFNRLGGVGSAIAGLIGGFAALELPVLWFLVDHHYRRAEIDRILAEVPRVAVGSLEELGRIDAPVAHLHTYNHNPAIVEALRGRRIVFTVHSLLRCEAEANGIDLGWAVERQERLIAAADTVVLVSEAERRHYRRLGYEALNPRVVVVHNGLADPGPPAARRLGRRVVGFCGRLVPRKRPEYPQWLLKEPGFEDFTSLIAGRGFSAYARALTADPELAGRVRYLGWCGGARLESFYRQIEVLAVPSTYEPFGMVALEAMARGVPVVCGRVDGLVEILGDEATYAADASYDAFREAMQRWRRGDPAAHRATARRARRRYLERFTDVAAARAYRAVFEELAGTAARAPA